MAQDQDSPRTGVEFDQAILEANSRQLLACLARIANLLLTMQAAGVQMPSALRQEVGNAVQLIMRARKA
jgi:hypothetical protein